MGAEQRRPSQEGQNETSQVPNPEKKNFKGAEIWRLFNEKGGKAIDSLPTGYAILNSQGQVIATNENLREMLGNPDAIKLGELFLVIPEDNAHIQELLEGKRIHFVSRIHDSSQGKDLRVNVTAPELDEKNRIILAEVDDITAEVEEIKAREAELEYIEQKANTISHNIGNYLTPALGWTTMARKSGEPIGPITARALDMTEKGIKNITGEALPILSKIRKEPEIKPIHITSVLRDVVNGYEEQLKSSGIKVVEQFEENLPQIKTDPFWTKEIFRNLVGNALKHGFKRDPNRPIADPILTLQCEFIKDHMLVTVRDNGHGIPPEVKDKIFTRYFTTHEDGTGEGLHIVSNRAGMIGWTVNVESLTQEEIDKGLANPETRLSFFRARRETTFTVTIPLEEKS